jgi:inosine-uridine nucleoside N-ribohydrolase
MRDMKNNHTIIDTDISLGQFGCDVDDALAIVLALNSPELIVESITTTYGNTTLKKATKILHELLWVWKSSQKDISTMKIPPIYQGSPIPLYKFPPNYRNYFISQINSFPQFQNSFKGDSKRDNSYINHNSLHNEFNSELITRKIKKGILFPAIKHIADLIIENPHQITLVPIGPLTNTALLFSVFPEVIPLLRKLSIMGGAIYNQYAYEFNFANDPIATNFVLFSKIHKEIAGLEVCEAQQFNISHYDKLKKSKSLLAKYIALKIYPWLLINKLRHRMKNNSGFFPYDSCAIINLIHPNIIKYSRIPVYHTIPKFFWDKANLNLKTLIDIEAFHSPSSEQLNWVDWGLKIDSEKYMSTLLQRISQ